MNSINKLTIELIPKTCWYSNVRSNVTTSVWDKLRKKSYSIANNKCQICNSTGLEQGFKHKVECHEIWKFDDILKTQKLIDLISLCPLCHKVKHIGLAEINNEFNRCLNHLCLVNNISKQAGTKYIDDCFKIWSNRSKYNWTLDITFIDTYLNEHTLFNEHIKDLF